MKTAIVLLHGSANGAASWGRVQRGLVARGLPSLAVDMLGYGDAPAPADGWSIDDEVAHLRRAIDEAGVADFQLVCHSLGSLFGLHLRLALGARVTGLTLIDPVLVSVLANTGEDEAYADMGRRYDSFMSAYEQQGPAEAAAVFVDAWNGAGTWQQLPEKSRAQIALTAPKVKLEMRAARAATTTAAEFAANIAADIAGAAPTTRILVGGQTLLPPRAVTRQLAPAFAATDARPNVTQLVVDVLPPGPQQGQQEIPLG